jgi:mannose-1-phosphate guanylyltransferase
MAAGAQHVQREGGLLTFGIRPTRPETGFGYLQVGMDHGSVDEWPVHRLARFVEKPDLETARRYLSEGGYLWNSGMFVWPVADLHAEIERQLPGLAGGLRKIDRSMGGDDPQAAIAAIYPTLERISVDYGIMENAETCWVMPVKFPWSDVGSWPSVAELMDADGDGTAGRGRVVSLGCTDSLLISDGPVVAAAGVKDLIVVATPDAVLVVPASDAQRVKEIVAELERREWDDVL